MQNATFESFSSLSCLYQFHLKYSCKLGLKTKSKKTIIWNIPEKLRSSPWAIGSSVWSRKSKEKRAKQRKLVISSTLKRIFMNSLLSSTEWKEHIDKKNQRPHLNIIQDAPLSITDEVFIEATRSRSVRYLVHAAVFSAFMFIVLSLSLSLFLTYSSKFSLSLFVSSRQAQYLFRFPSSILPIFLISL